MDHKEYEERRELLLDNLLSTDTRLAERRRSIFLSDETIEEIAEKAADKAVEKMENKLYIQVGKTFLDKLFKVIGILILGAALYLDSKGFLKGTFGD